MRTKHTKGPPPWPQKGPNPVKAARPAASSPTLALAQTRPDTLKYRAPDLPLVQKKRKPDHGTLSSNGTQYTTVLAIYKK